MMSGADTDPAAMATTVSLKKIRSKCQHENVKDRFDNVNTDTDALAPPGG